LDGYIARLANYKIKPFFAELHGRAEAKLIF